MDRGMKFDNWELDSISSLVDEWNAFLFISQLGKKKLIEYFYSSFFLCKNQSLSCICLIHCN